MAMKPAQRILEREDAMVAYREQANRAVRLGRARLVTNRGLHGFATRVIRRMTDSLKAELDHLEDPRTASGGPQKPQDGRRLSRR